MKTLLIAISILAAQSSFASRSGVWLGTGTLFDIDGNVKSHYQLQVNRTKLGNQIQSEVTITLADGTVTKEQCQITELGPNAWKSDCGFGSGGGGCFGNGLCSDYVADANGTAFATTIVMDGANHMRMLRTGLKNGQAFEFFQEKLHKKQ